MTIKRRKTILDIGAANLDPKKIENDCEYYLFEPFMNSYKNLIQTFKRYNNVKIFNFAIHDIEGELNFFITNKKECCSLLEPNIENIKNYTDPKRFQVECMEKIKTKRLDNIEEVLDILKIDVLKIDTQGTTYNVLKSCGNLLNKVDKIICESEFVELYKDEKLDDEIEFFLLNHGFERIENLRTVKWGYKKIFCDAVYKKKEKK